MEQPCCVEGSEEEEETGSAGHCMASKSWKTLEGEGAELAAVLHPRCKQQSKSTKVEAQGARGPLELNPEEEGGGHPLS